MPKILSVRTLFYLFLLHALDVSFMPLVRIGSLQPSLLYFLVIYAAFKWQGKRCIQVAVLAGLLRDFSGSLPLGIETASLVSMAMLLHYGIHKLERDPVYMRIATTFLFVLSVSVVQVAFCVLLGFQMPPLSWVLAVSLGNSVMSAILIPFFFKATIYWFKDYAYLGQYELF